ncbi:MAG TPA: tRNA dihydrouridine(20/20a) synthase DusA [Gammaproteobacteria bacterium]|nr:tRNA dihydrouridine(20/20a) synthase DusA [Gammaproteobacteria bacterium]
MPVNDCPVSVAPMLDWTDRHCRYFLRLISRHVRLYTEMITSAALLHGDRERLLAHHAAEYPLAIQLGGSEPELLAECAHLAEQAGYSEVNLNVGCPSDRVQSGRFGACLMLEPERVAACVTAMRAAVSIPVTVKTRTGVDAHDSYAELVRFVECLSEAGLECLIVHARKAWLSGLSPKQNREVPPLCYDRVYRLKADFPGLEVHINGGIKTLDEVALHLEHVDGVMIGREAYHNPYLLADVDHRFAQDDSPAPSRHEVVQRFLPYVETQLANGVRLQQMSRHVLGLFQGLPGARAWRRHISEHAHRPGAGIEVLEQALACVPHPDEGVKPATESSSSARVHP